jgi:hypothetical protein
VLCGSKFHWRPSVFPSRDCRAPVPDRVGDDPAIHRKDGSLLCSRRLPGSSPLLSGLHQGTFRGLPKARPVADEPSSTLNLNGKSRGLDPVTRLRRFDSHRFGASLMLEVTGCFVLLLLSSPFLPSARLLPAPSRKRRRRPIPRANPAAASAGCRMASAAKLQQADGLLN